jgi:hypothetical protein
MPGNKNMMFPVMKRERLIYQIMFILGQEDPIDETYRGLHKTYLKLIDNITVLTITKMPLWMVLNTKIRTELNKKGVFDRNNLIEQQREHLELLKGQTKEAGQIEQINEAIKYFKQISNYINSFIETINWDEETIKRMFKNIRRNNQNSSDGEKITFTQIEYTIADELYIKISNPNSLKSISNDPNDDNTDLNMYPEPNDKKTTDLSESADSEIIDIFKSHTSPLKRTPKPSPKRISDTNIDEEPRTHSGSLSTSPTKRTPSPRTVQSSPVPHTDTTLPPVPHTDTTLPPVPLTDRKPVPPTGSKPSSIKTRPTRRNGGKKQKNKITKRHRKNKK